MKKLYIVYFLLFFFVQANSQSIIDTRHNLSASGKGDLKSDSESGICIFCHTSHSTSPEGPLWNRKDKGTNYILYDNAISNTLQALTGQPDGTSVLCLSCHDGTTAVNKFAGGMKEISFSERKTMMRGKNNLSTDLSNDHPISFEYNSALSAIDGQLKYPPTFPVRLDNNGKVQCTSCHDPHTDVNEKFLVATIQYSRLCFSCHEVNFWSNSSHQSSQETWNGTGRNPWKHIENPFSSVSENACENCHNMHNADGKARLLKSGIEENNCIDCHNGNVASTNIEAQLNKTYRHNVYAYNGIHNPLENSKPAVTHVECVDCHNAHAVNSIKAEAPYANGFISGVQGVDQLGNKVENIQFEYELCYRCHSDNPASGSTKPRQIEQNNVRLEFAPSNPSFHPISTAGKNDNVPSLVATLNESSMIYCTDCHASDGKNSPAGPHGSIYPGLLKYRYETADNTIESSFSYELCYSCHERNSILNNESFKGHKSHVKDENTSCSTCHDPHGISTAQGNSTNNSNLINFDKSIVFSTQEGNLRYVDNGLFSGYCLLKCHGKTHDAGMMY